MKNMDKGVKRLGHHVRLPGKNTEHPDWFAKAQRPIHRLEILAPSGGRHLQHVFLPDLVFGYQR